MTSNAWLASLLALVFLSLGITHMLRAQRRADDKPTTHMVIALVWFWLAIVTVLSHRAG